MKWVSSQHSAENMIYSLEGEEGTLLKMRYKPGQHTARIEAGIEKRVFIIEKQGFFKNRIVFRNEYGVRIGWLDCGNLFSNEGDIEIDGEKFRYSLMNNPLAELLIYKDLNEEPIVRCSLTASQTNGLTGVDWSNNQSMLKSNTYCLLLATCWYLFQPTARENMLAYAG
jgi:hypothetical protein